MDPKYQSLAEFFNVWGIGSTIAGALAGRLMWHTQETRKNRRKFFGPELLWEIPIAVGMAFIGEGLASWLQLGQPMSTGLIAALAYLGPRGSEVLFMRWFGAKIEKDI